VMKSMSEKVFVDSNVFVYAHDVDYAAKQRIATSPSRGSCMPVCNAKRRALLSGTIRRGKFKRSSQPTLSPLRSWKSVLDSATGTHYWCFQPRKRGPNS
jgi:hypothetical protein